MKNQTIYLKKETKEKLTQLKISKRETYDEVITRILSGKSNTELEQLRKEFEVIKKIVVENMSLENQ